MSLRGTTLLALGVLLASGCRAVEAQRPNWIGFRGDMGIEVPRGALDSVLIGNVRGEFSILITPRWLDPVYFGGGQGWVAYPVQPPYGVRVWPDTIPDTDRGEWWNHVGAFLLLGINLDGIIPLPLYGEGRFVYNRLRQLSRDDWEGRPERGRLKYQNFKGLGWSGAIGMEQRIAPRTWVDSALRISQFRPHADLKDKERFGLIDIRDGWMLGLQLGLTWFP